MTWDCWVLLEMSWIVVCGVGFGLVMLVFVIFDRVGFVVGGFVITRRVCSPKVCS